MPKVNARLQTAFVWDCDECGHENFERSIVAELTDDEAEDAYRKVHDLDEVWDELPDDWRDFQMVTYHDSVTCKKCGERFETERDV